METRAKRMPRPALPEGLSDAAETAPEPQLAAEPAPPAQPIPAAAVEAEAADGLRALMESQAAMARGLTALGAEMAELARGGIDAATKSAGELLSARTWADAVEINAGLAKRHFEALLDGSARLSQLGVKLATEASAPIIAQLNRDWTRPAR